MAHTCHAIACEVPVPPAMLMCRPHWFRVPKSLRDRVWAEYENGVTRAYCDAAKAAVTAVAEKEGRTVTGKEPELLLYDWIQTED
jgi:hypothetical protein